MNMNISVLPAIISSLVLLFLLFLKPDFSLTLFYPLTWVFWSYNAPFLGGRLERITGLLAIAGVIILFGSSHRRLPVFPKNVAIGLAIFSTAYLLSFIVNLFPEGGAEYLFSLAMRLIFLYLVFVLVNTRSLIRKTTWLFVGMGLFAGLFILVLNLVYGIGFFRETDALAVAQQTLGSFWYSALMGSNSLTYPAILLIGFYPVVQKKSYRWLVILAVVFLFLMAFFAQFRREILVSVTMMLMYVILTNYGRLRRPAIWILLITIPIMFYWIFPMEIFQSRIAETTAILKGTDVRQVSFLAGIQAFLRSPILGYGPGTYDGAVYRIMGSGYASVEYHAYNVFIWIAVEAGIFGLAGLLLTLLQVYGQSTRFKLTNTPEGLILRCAPMLLLQIVVSFLFGNYWDMSLPWFLMGLILSAARVTRIEMRSVL